MCVLRQSFLPFVLSLSQSPLFSFIWHFNPSILCVDSLYLPSWAHPRLSLLSLVVASDLKDFQNNKNRYLIASENQRPGHFSTAPIGSLTASPSSGALCNQGGLQSVTSIQERIMSTPGGEEAIERLKVKMTWGPFKWHKASHSSHEREKTQTPYPANHWEGLFQPLQKQESND